MDFNINEMYEQYKGKPDTNYSIEDLKFELFLVKENLENNASLKDKTLLKKYFEIHEKLRIAEGKDIINYILLKIKTP